MNKSVRCAPPHAKTLASNVLELTRIVAVLIDEIQDGGGLDLGTAGTLQARLANLQTRFPNVP